MDGSSTKYDLTHDVLEALSLPGFNLNILGPAFLYGIFLNVTISQQSTKRWKDLVDDRDDERGNKPECPFDEEKCDTIPPKIFHPAGFLRSQECFGFKCAHGCLPYSGNEVEAWLRAKPRSQIHSSDFHRDKVVAGCDLPRAFPLRTWGMSMGTRC